MNTNTNHCYEGISPASQQKRKPNSFHRRKWVARPRSIEEEEGDQLSLHRIMEISEHQLTFSETENNGGWKNW